jgi:hypothetical protein
MGGGYAHHNGYRSHYKHPADSMNLPVIPADGESPQYYSNGYHDPHDPAFMTHRGRGGGGGEGDGGADESAHGAEGFTERRRRHIVVDMPHIIFNAATPDLAKDAASRGENSKPYHHHHHHHHHHGSVPPPSTPLVATSSTNGDSVRPGTLSKTLKQKEIRQRELHNLLEDVRELNKRSETLHSQATETELDTATPF